MEASWTSQLVGRTVERVETSEGCPCVVSFSGGYRLQIESLWRVLSAGTLALTSKDEGQLFAGSQPLCAVSEISSKLLGQTLARFQVAPGTADLTLEFGQSVLQVLADSSGYEAWQVEGPTGTVAVGQGGGNVAVWG